MKKKIKGVWIFGMSGSGKTFASKYFNKIAKKPFLIDGHIIRKHISFDLKHNLSDRIIQTKRLIGLAKICIAQGYFPIICSVFLGKKISSIAKKINIEIVQIKREKKFLNKKIKDKKNIVGLDIKQPKINSLYIVNDKNFRQNLRKVFKN
tara:strand:+ start:89 stop:538 length:450 start_codon:yes stop_codon:yes gene_type:complete